MRTVSYYYRHGILLLALALFSFTLFADDSCLDVSDANHLPTSLVEHVQFFEDKSAAYAITDIQAPSITRQFTRQQSSAEAFNFGYTSSVYWFRFTLCNSTNLPIEQIIEIGESNISTLTFYEFNDAQRTQMLATGLSEPFATRRYDNRHFIFPITLAAHAHQVYYLKVQSLHALIVPLKLWPPARFHQHERDDYFAQALYFGMMGAMIVFNALIFTVLRDTIYLLYVGYITFFALYIASITGLGKAFLWPNAAGVDIFSVELCDLTIIALLLFTRRMLNTQATVPTLDSLLKVCVVAYVAQGIVGFIALDLVINRFASVMHLALALLILVVSILCAIKRQRNAYFFLVAFCMLFIGAVAMTLRVLGMLPTNEFTVSSFQYASGWEILILAFALADRFNSIRKEKEKIQTDLLTTQHLLVENLKMSEQQLEKQVNERTTELQQLNETLNQKENYLRQLIDNFPFMIWLKDTQSRFIAVNYALAKHYGKTHTDHLLGKTDFDFCHKDVATRYQQDELWVLHAKQSKVDETQIVDAQGVTSWAEILRAPLVDSENNVLGTVGFAQNISARKQFEADTEALHQSKSTFFANMSHEIRTPMNGIIGLSQLALKKDISGEVKSYVEKIYSSSTALLTIINSILDFSKLESNNASLDQSPFHLETILNSVDTLFEYNKQENQATQFTLNVAEDVPRNLIGDATKLRQVLINLLSNAKKFTSQGEITTTITLTSQCHDTVTLHFAVQDTGIGMTAQQIEKLFQPFSQADNSITRNYGGTGLGLVICKQLVDLMGGRINVSSYYGVGSTFEFTVPFTLAPTQVSVSHALSLPFSSPPYYEGHRILLIEDNEINQIVAQELLTSMGFHVDVAHNGKEGVERALAQPFDFILMDIQMPIMDGFTATRLIRAEARTQAIPIVAMTSHAMEGDREKSLAAGMNAHLTKPIDIPQLVAVLNLWFDPAERPLSQKIAQSTHTTALPSTLPPFDLPQALTLCNQNATLLHQLLANFSHHYHDTAQQLTALIQQKNFSGAHQVVHAIIGVTGTLGAHELRGVATALQRALRLENSHHIAPLLNDFSRALTLALKAAASLPPVEKTVLVSSLKIEEVNERFVQFKHALSSNEFKALHLFSELRPHFLHCNMQNVVSELDHYLDRLNFNQALHVLNDIPVLTARHVTEPT